MLKGFQKINLQPGESKVVSFKIGANELAFHTADLYFVVEEGTFRLYMGPNSRDVQLVEFEWVD
ncbi:Periplasmic beta-glucosidase precursor [compost metagenome]